MNDSAAASPTLYVIGGINIDLIVGKIAEWPRRGTEILLADSECRAGGSAANTALAFAALGGRCRTIANVGADMFGRFLADAFEDSAAWRRTACPTTITIGVSHSDGERTLLTTRGHLAAFSLNDVLEQLPARAAAGDVALLCCPFLEPLLLERFETLLGILVERGFAVALDTGWPPEGWTTAIRAQVEAWLPYCRHVLLNEIETLGLADMAELDQAVARLRRRLPPDATMVVKRGREGAAAWRRDRHVERPARSVQVVDTIGAGDIFNAGYLAGEMRGLPLDAALALGIEVACRAISTHPRRY